MYVTEEDYKEYFGTENVPTPFSRFETLAVASLQEYCVTLPCVDCMTNLTEEKQELIKKAILEQMNYMDLNGDSLDGSAITSFGIGRFNASISGDSSPYNKFAMQLLDSSGVCNRAVCYDYTNKCNSCGCDKDD